MVLVTAARGSHGAHGRGWTASAQSKPHELEPHTQVWPEKRIRLMEGESRQVRCASAWLPSLLVAARGETCAPRTHLDLSTSMVGSNPATPLLNPPTTTDLDQRLLTGLIQLLT